MNPRLVPPLSFVFVAALSTLAGPAHGPAFGQEARFTPPPEPRPSAQPGPGHFEDLVSVKFQNGLHVRCRAGGITDEGTGDLDSALELLADRAAGTWTRCHRLSEEKLAEYVARAEANSGRAMPDLNLEFRLHLAPGLDARAAIEALRALAIVDYAWPVAKPAAPPTVPDFTQYQNYLGAAPNGLNARATWPRPAGTGRQVRICDVEYECNPWHRDMPTVNFVNPDPNLGIGREHGTAVMGVLFAKSDGEGTTGVAYGAEAWFSPVVPAWVPQHGINVAAAITDAHQYLEKGDVMLIEQQMPGPLWPYFPCCSTNSCLSGEDCQQGYVPVEWDPNVRNAILVTVGLGIHVVEAAGNGTQNLDDALYSNPPFAPPFPPFLLANDSGAILVGAGAAPGSSSGTPHLSRLWFSNYGATVDVQGQGEDVETTGYYTGPLATGNWGSPGSIDAYTHNFGGTSSASPMVAAACALLGSTFENQTRWPLDPKAMREILILTGTPQTGAAHIGPRPDVSRAITELELWRSGDKDPWLGGMAFGGPTARRDAACAYDSGRGRLVVFGGDFFGASLGDMWAVKLDSTLPGSQWTSLPSAGPSPRSGAALAYDQKRDRYVLFGGDSFGVPNAETWEFDPTLQTWTFVNFGPTARSGHAMAYDPLRERVVLVGGNCGAACGGTYEWDGTSWTGFPGPVASGRIRSSMTWDSDRSRMIVFGGHDPLNFTDTSELWERSGTSWGASGSSGPSARNGAGLVYDTSRRRTVLYGGTTFAGGYLDDTWEWNGTQWAARNGPFAFPARGRACVAYDAAAGRLFVFGGETWGAVQLAEELTRDREFELGATYCFGDGTGAACPCGNASSKFDGAGCLHSLGSGARLRGRGRANLSMLPGNPPALLEGFDMPNSAALYFQGTLQQSGGNGLVFGDGLRCAVGSVIRLGTKFNAGGHSLYPDTGDLPIAIKGGILMPGTIRTYQIWYRNAAAFCTSSTFNLSNGLQIVWGL